MVKRRVEEKTVKVKTYYYTCKYCGSEFKASKDRRDLVCGKNECQGISYRERNGRQIALREFQINLIRYLLVESTIVELRTYQDSWDFMPAPVLDAIVIQAPDGKRYRFEFPESYDSFGDRNELYLHNLELEELEEKP